MKTDIFLNVFLSKCFSKVKNNKNKVNFYRTSFETKYKDAFIQ